MSSPNWTGGIFLMALLYGGFNNGIKNNPAHILPVSGFGKL